MSEIGLYLDGQQQHAVRPIQPDYANELYIWAYTTAYSLEQESRVKTKEYSSVVTITGTDILCTHLTSLATADLGEDDHFNLMRQGSVRLALKFLKHSVLPLLSLLTPNSKT